MFYIKQLLKYFKFLIYFCIKVCFWVFIILVAMYLFWIGYLYFFVDRISEIDARNIVLNVIKTKYSTICGGNFEKHLTLKVDGHNAKYEFYSDNGTCNIFVDVNEFGGYENGIMENSTYSNSGSIIIEPHK